MNHITPADPAALRGPGGVGSTLQLDMVGATEQSAAQFRAELDRHLQSGATARSDADKNSLGDRIIDRTNNLASSLKQDQQYVSKLLEQATRSANSMDLMKAMVALNEYNLRVQFVSKTTSKAVSSVDQLTRLQ